MFHNIVPESFDFLFSEWKDREAVHFFIFSLVTTNSNFLSFLPLWTTNGINLYIIFSEVFKLWSLDPETKKEINIVCIENMHSMRNDINDPERIVLDPETMIEYPAKDILGFFEISDFTFFKSVVEKFRIL